MNTENGTGGRRSSGSFLSGSSIQDGAGDYTGERFLKNPLPVPKRRPHVKMEFDLSDDWDVTDEQDHFDIEIDDGDDFDL